MPGTKSMAKERTAPLYADIGATINRIDEKGGLADQLEQAKVKLGQVQVKQEETSKSFQGFGKNAAAEIEGFLKPALDGLMTAQSNAAEGNKAVAEASTAATKIEVDNINIMIAKYNELNAVKLSGKGTFSSVESFADALEDEADR
jgi:hypothetical protein